VKNQFKENPKTSIAKTTKEPTKEDEQEEADGHENEAQKTQEGRRRTLGTSLLMSLLREKYSRLRLVWDDESLSW